MMGIRKTAVALLAVPLSAALFTGCTSSGDKQASSSESPGAGKSKEMVKLTAAFPGQESPGQKAALQAINKKLQADGLNVEVDFKYLDDYFNKLALNVAGGTVYDLAWAHSSTLSDLVAKKVYQPIDLQKNGADLIKNGPDYVLKGGQIKDKQYAVPRAIPMTGFNNVYNIRGDLREKYGIPKITTVEGLEQYFAAIKKMNPTCTRSSATTFRSCSRSTPITTSRSATAVSIRFISIRPTARTP
ncbi:extracellular solute-binding protein [Paenibacillus sp. CC-CFT747]|nr:extracellular solute-binding protein [Paenibacillus sp. CC-CFT747]